ncbi:RIP metalloprotease RseP [Capnocytophaga canimorsus]|uniref:RIP metalloprotease RseP n=1 Tax=Capnocytophaga canimorsus TaxID=28188 RepID=UPI00385CED78
METFFIKAAQLILSLSILVVLHELGHFIPAKIFKTRVEKFFLFFDVKFALFKKKIGETVYGIGWLPLGGYVKISGMIDESMDKEQMAQPPQPWEFRSKPAWQRLIIMIGGVTVNLLLGFFIYAMILFTWGEHQVKENTIEGGFAVTKTMRDFGVQNGDIVTQINGKPIENLLDVNRHIMMRNVSSLTVKRLDGSTKEISLPDSIGKTLFLRGEMTPFNAKIKPIIDSVLADSPASKAGLKKGDKIIDINGRIIHYHCDISPAIATNAENGNVTINIERDGQHQVFNISLDKKQRMGFVFSQQEGKISTVTKTYDFLSALSTGISYGYWTLRDYVAQFKFVFTKKGATEVGGFAAIGNMFPPVWDWKAFWHTTALISIMLAFMNILPIPALDGGHVIFLLYEMVTSRKPSDKVLEYAQMVGFFILIALLLFANGNDLYKWLFK